MIIVLDYLLFVMSNLGKMYPCGYKQNGSKICVPIAVALLRCLCYNTEEFFSYFMKRPTC